MCRSWERIYVKALFTSSVQDKSLNDTSVVGLLQYCVWPLLSSAVFD